MFSQRDPNYSFIRLGTSAETIGTAGCLLCDLAFALDSLPSGRPQDPPRLNRYLAQMSGYSKNNHIVYAALGPLGLHCIHAVNCERGPADERDIAATINQAYVVCIKVHFRPWAPLFMEHWLLATGVVNDDVECLDPWLPAESNPFVGILSHYARPDWTLGRAVYEYVVFDYAGRDPAKRLY